MTAFNRQDASDVERRAGGILTSHEQSVIDKMRERGVPLREWNVKTNCGSETGYNFALIIDTAYSNRKAFMITGDSMKYLYGILNSSLIAWFMRSTGIPTGMGLVQWDKFAIERIPIPKLTDAEQKPFIRLVDRILKEKSDNPKADTTVLEWDINDLVYDLYGLTETEIDEIEGSLDTVPLTAAQQDAAMLNAMLEGREAAKAEGYASREEVMAILADSDGN